MTTRDKSFCPHCAAAEHSLSLLRGEHERLKVEVAGYQAALNTPLRRSLMAEAELSTLKASLTRTIEEMRAEYLADPRPTAMRLLTYADSLALLLQGTEERNRQEDLARMDESK